MTVARNGIFIWCEKAKRRYKKLVTFALGKKLKSIWSITSYGYEAYCTLCLWAFFRAVSGWNALLMPTPNSYPPRQCPSPLLPVPGKLHSFSRTQLERQWLWNLPCQAKLHPPCSYSFSSDHSWGNYTWHYMNGHLSALLYLPLLTRLQGSWDGGLFFPRNVTLKTALPEASALVFQEAS